MSEDSGGMRATEDSGDDIGSPLAAWNRLLTTGSTKKGGEETGGERERRRAKLIAKKKMGGVRGVIVDASVLLAIDDNNNATPSLRPGAEFLLRALQFSQLRKGLCYGSNLSNDKLTFLERMSRLYSFDCFSFNVSSLDDVIPEIATAWGDIGGTIMCFISSYNKDFYHKMCNYGWLIVVLNVDAVGDISESPSISYVKKLEELPLNICRLNRKGNENKVITVGYVMKPSRQTDFAKRGAFPIYSEQEGLMFLPLTYELPMPLQLQELDVVLHKATDEIISIELSDFSAASPKISYTGGMQELKRSLEHQPNCLVIDPFDKIYPVLDRLKIQHILLGLEELNIEGHLRIRGPHFLKVDKFNDPDLMGRLSAAKLSLPSIVKPQVACGVADAHKMAIVFRFEDYKDLNLPLPAIVQEYVDHSSLLFKFYVLGEEVFYATKKSTPNADILMKSSQANELKPLSFDSLKSLPTVDEIHSGSEVGTNAEKDIDLELVTNAANWLRRKLDLTIFGFDVVIQEGTGDHVVVDVNYLPSFKEVPDNVAIPAFWKAIKSKFVTNRSESGNM
ncbi:hypothetical protein Nepgr_020110 [Nepenthes gracilis]|uniref:inositol-1,3,4-trisphosphate 5/6-kinase n=1 Tax=Nepenthes gracilis TaxID=150966 RepID=A0AAD3XVQ7_NEPGR|nr:hypothetical protein Nepgr_020110 [Nepenthes gracilis]